MTAPAPADMKPRRRWFSPRFSLKMLMLVVTAAAISSAVWWRWPVTVVSEKRNGSSVIKEASTYHRGLRGDLIKHGLSRRTINGKLELEGDWFEGELGKCEYRTGNTVLAYEFNNRKLIAAPHAPRGSLLVQRLNDPALKQSAEALWADVDLDYPATPFKEVIEDMRERFGLLLAIRSRRENILEAPVTVNVKQWPLRMGFDAILSPRGLVLDYRYGVLCIVDAAGAANWQDSTGVAELQPPPETPLAERLDAPPKVTPIELRRVTRDKASGRATHEVPSSGILRNLAADQDISLRLLLTEEDWEGLEARNDGMFGLPREVLMIRGEPSTMPKEPLAVTLRQLLGLILDKAELKCHEENGVLIIEPQQKTVAGPAARESK